MTSPYTGNEATELDIAQIEALFGTSDDDVVTAVRRFESRRPGTLDWQHFMIAAASAPHLGGPDNVARVVNALPVTRMTFSAKPIDFAAVRDNFEQSIRTFWPQTRVTLVIDLIQQSTAELVAVTPAERMTPSGRAIAEGQLWGSLGNSTDRVAKAVSSPFVGSRLIARAREHLEGRVLEAHTADLTTMRTDLRRVVPLVDAVLDPDNSATTAEDVQHVWSLARRCTSTEREMFDLLEKALVNPKLNALTAHSMLDVISTMRDEGAKLKLRGLMIGVPQRDMDVVVRAVEEGAGSATGRGVDPRLIALRRYHYGRRRSTLNEPLTSEEIDRLVADLPIDEIADGVVAAIESPEVLETIAAKSHRLGRGYWMELVSNPNIDRETLRYVLTSKPSGRDRFARIGKTWVSDEQLQDQYLCKSNVFSDTEIARRIESRGGEQATIALRYAASNPSIGEHVMRLIEGHPERADLLFRVATSNPSPSVQKMVSDIALTHDDHNLAASLQQNVLLDIAVVDALAARFPDLDPRLDAVEHAFVYADPVEVADRLIAGSLTMDRVDQLISWGFNSEPGEKTYVALQRLADARVLSESQWHRLSLQEPISAGGFLTHPNCPSTSSFAISAETQLADTAAAIERGIGTVPSDADMRGRRWKWKKLPNSEDVPLERYLMTDLVDGRTVDERVLHVPATLRELRDLSERTDTVFDHSAISAGTSVVAEAGIGGNTVAVQWEVDGHRLTRDNVNIYFQLAAKGRLAVGDPQLSARWNIEVAPHFDAALGELTHALRAGTLSRRDSVGYLDREGEDVERLDVGPAQALRASSSHRPARRRRLTLAGSNQSAEQSVPMARESGYLLGRNETSSRAEIEVPDADVRSTQSDEPTRQVGRHRAVAEPTTDSGVTTDGFDVGGP